jgi:hypothetical protein
VNTARIFTETQSMARNSGQSAERRAGSYCSIFKMEVRFYKELNNLSTADFIAYKATSRRGKLYKIERVIAKKMRKGKVSYLIC